MATGIFLWCAVPCSFTGVCEAEHVRTRKEGNTHLFEGFLEDLEKASLGA